MLKGCASAETLMSICSRRKIFKFACRAHRNLFVNHREKRISRRIKFQL